MLTRYSRLLIWAGLALTICIVYIAGHKAGSKIGLADISAKPQYLKIIESDMGGLYNQFHDHAKSLLESRVKDIRDSACKSSFDMNLVKGVFTSNSYKAHLKRLKKEFKRLDAILKVITPTHSKITYGDGPRLHKNSKLVDTSPETKEYRDYVESMEKKIGKRTPGSHPGNNESSIILLTAVHSPSQQLISERDKWAHIHGQHHIVVDLDKYHHNNTLLDRKVTDHWLYITAIEETIHRFDSDWIWYLHPDLELKDQQYDVLNILDQLELFGLKKFPLQSSHRNLKGGVLAPKVSSANASFVVTSNRVALDTSSMFIRNQDSTLRYLQYWCAMLNIIDDGMFWNLDDQFDNRSAEAFAHMYRVYDFLRHKTAVITQNAVPVIKTDGTNGE